MGVDDGPARRDEVLRAVRRALPASALDRSPTVKALTLSTEDHDDHRTQRVRLESLPGRCVDATVYLPKRPDAYPGIVCAGAGVPAQMLARSGYMAVVLDTLVDHAIDCLRALDYLLTRPDHDPRRALSITGIGAGALTAVLAALVDRRVGFTAVADCAGRATGVDAVDLLGALAPRPCLIMGDAPLYEHVRRVYQQTGNPNACGLSVDPGGATGYTSAMAAEVVRWMDRIILHKEPAGQRDTDMAP